MIHVCIDENWSWANEAEVLHRISTLSLRLLNWNCSRVSICFLAQNITPVEGYWFQKSICQTVQSWRHGKKHWHWLEILSFVPKVDLSSVMTPVLKMSYMITLCCNGFLKCNAWKVTWTLLQNCVWPTQLAVIGISHNESGLQSAQKQ